MSDQVLLVTTAGPLKAARKNGYLALSADLDQTSLDGGGTISFTQRGTLTMTKPLSISSNTQIYIGAGVTIDATGLSAACFTSSSTENVSITGPGVIVCTSSTVPSFTNVDGLTVDIRIEDASGNPLEPSITTSSSARSKSEYPNTISRTVSQVYGYGIKQLPSDGHSIGIWRPSTTYVAGDKVFPSAYLSEATWFGASAGFVSSGGQLYCLVCITGGRSATSEPSWPDPAGISNWSWANTAGLNVTDGGVTWRIRKAVFIDPTASAGGTGTHLSPYDDWAGEVGHATGIIANDPIDPTSGTNTGAQYMGSVFLQRAGTTVTSSSTVLRIRGPKSSVADDQSGYTTPSAAAVTDIPPRYLLFGSYRKPYDAPVRPKLVKTGTTGGTAQGCVYGDNKIQYALADLDISNTSTGNKAHGLLRYSTPAGTGTGRTDIVTSRCVFHDCGGHGSIYATYDGESDDLGRNGIQYYDCDFHSNEGFGAFATGVIAAPPGGYAMNWDNTPRTSSVLYSRCRSWNNGKATAEQAYHHGFSSIAFRKSYGDGLTTGLSGWTNASGTIYYRGSLTPDSGTLTTINQVYGCVYRSEGGMFPAVLKKNTSTPTTPAAGEFGYDTGTSRLYINLGAAIDVRTQVIAQFAPCKDILYENCESWGNNAYDNGSELVEGYGFGVDEFSQAQLLHCIAHDNERCGFFMHYSLGSVLRNCVAFNNHSYGIFPSACINTAIASCDVDNHTYGVAAFWGSAGTTITGTTIRDCKYGVAWYDAPSTPYNVSAYPLVPGVVGGGNIFAGIGTANYAEYDLVSAYVAQSDLTGDINVT